MTRALAMLSIVALLSAFAMQAAGCEAVPSLTFAEDAGDAGADDGSTQSEASGTGCQRTPAPTACCNGLVPCYGDQCTEAGACAAWCGACHPATEKCCPKNGMLSCVGVNSPTFCP
jgi:hypothetical protein